MRIGLTWSRNMSLDRAINFRLQEPHPNHTDKVSLRVLDRLLHAHLHPPLRLRKAFVDLGPMEVRRNDLSLIYVSCGRLKREVGRGIHGWNNWSDGRGLDRSVRSESDRLGNKLSPAKPGLLADI